MTRTEKTEIVNYLTEQFGSVTAVVICDYKGLGVSDLESLRKKARENDANVQVVKNTLATIALNNAQMSGIELKDMNIFIWSDDVVAAAKVAADFAKENDNLSIKAGYLDKEAADKAKIEAFAKLPGRNELLGMLAATWMAPLTNFTIGLDALRKKREEEA